MAESGHQNVFRGPQSVANYYDPDCQPPLPLVEIPQGLNPFHGDGVHIFAKMLTSLPAHNIKLLPALNMLTPPHIPPGTRTIVEQSSGSTIVSMSIIARILSGIEDVKAFITNKTSESRIRLLRFFGLEVILYGGPPQPPADDPRGGLHRASQYARENKGAFNPNQYQNEQNWISHFKWTGPQILRQLPETNLVCIPVGSAGCITGVSRYLKEKIANVVSIGVTSYFTDPVPGPRPTVRVEESSFPWRETTDHVEQVSSTESFLESMRLSREGIICGPSSGLCLRGLLNFLAREKAENGLSRLPRTEGRIHCVFFCCDLPYQYLGDYFDKLGEDTFRPIVNKNLLRVDLDMYDEGWELDTARFRDYYHHRSAADPPTIIVDFRSSSCFAASSIPGSTNLPLATLSAPDAGGRLVSPYHDADLLERQWTELHSLFARGSRGFSLLTAGGGSSDTATALLLCDDGDTSRLASSILRAKGVEAFSLKGGTSGVSGSLGELMD